MVVVGPVCHAPETGAGTEVLWLREQRHERDESAVAAAIDADALGVDPVFLLEILRSIDVVLQVAPSHPPVDGGPPVAAISGGAAIVDVEHDVALRREVL